MLKLRYSVNRILAARPSREEALRHVLSAVLESLGWQLGEIWSEDAPAGTLVRTATVTAPGTDLADFVAASADISHSPGAGLPGRIWSTGQAHWVPDATDDPGTPRAELAKRAGLRGACGFPIAVGEKAVGAAVFFSRAVERPDPERLDALTSLGSLLGQFLARRLAEDALAQRERLARVSADVSMAVVQGGGLRPMAQRCTEVIVQHLDAAFARIWTLDVSRTVLELQASAGMYTHLNGGHARVLVGKFKIGLIAQERRALLTNSVLDDPRIGDPAWAKREGMVAFAGHPLIAGDELLGVLAMFARHPLGDYALEALAAVADVIALAIQQKRTEETLQRRSEQLWQSQKLEAIGRLAGGVAHDFNNLLTVIIGNATELLDAVGPQDPRSRDVESILNAGERASSLVRQLLAFSRKQLMEPKVLDAGELVTNLQKMLRRMIGEDIELEARVGPGPATVKADPGQLEQVIVNLAVNARDAMPRGGRLTIEVSTLQLETGLRSYNLEVAAGRYVTVSLTDGGSGMDADTLSHLFEPFFTTKDRARGSGLGLSTVHGIIAQSGGTIQVNSQPGGGSTFRILLPAVAPEPVKPRAEKGAQPLPRGDETVLLVEDEEALLEFVRRVLAGCGYRVLTADRGADALEICRMHEGPIHLILSDVVMPQMSGPDFVAQAVVLRPGSRVLYMSGYSDDALGPLGVLATGVAVLAKPFTPAALSRRVREVLDKPAPRP